MKNTDKINKKYEQQHLDNIRRNQKRVKRAYNKAIDKIYAGLSLPKPSVAFDITKYPRINNIVNEVLAEWNEEFLTIMVNGVHEAWNLSETKLDEILGQYTAGRAMLPKIKEALNSKNQEALNAFLDRTSGPQGLDLSQRVWNYQNQFRSEIEKNMAIGIEQGVPAAKLASQQKQYLVEPDRLFRRVRDMEGNLVLSKAAKLYNPGQGVYRSSYKNALRFTRTETNLAYRSSDNDRYSRSQVILGYEVKLSARHPMFDICDHLKGEYPKTFKFVGWHPQCICYTVPKLPTASEYKKFEDAVLNGENYTFKDQVSQPPKGFGEYVKANSDRINNRKSLPYWIRDNKNSFDLAVKSAKNTLVLTKQETKVFLKDKLDTEKVFMVDGKYLPERKILHDRIVNDYFDQFSKTEGSKVFMLGGAPANGKSTVVDGGFLPHPKGAFIVDPDRIKSMIPEYRMLLGQKDKSLVKSAANFVHEESSYLGKQIRKKALEQSYAAVLDGVNDGKIEKLMNNVAAIRKESGGKPIRADYVSLDTGLSLKLAEARAKATGRNVPLDHVRDQNREISILLPKAIEEKVFDELYLWDTNLEGKARLVLTQINGKLKIHDQKLYNDFLKKAN
ncbi:zeta toxin family protein [Sphingobacterium yanglingense]|nr:zeta toxin family protein [Sphingobacterium yanglingense]